jgi:hypothetical protein
MPVYQQPNVVTAETATVNAKEVEIDFGPIPVYDGTFIVYDITISSNSNIIAQVSGNTPTEKDSDEVMMDSYLVLATPGTGQCSFYIRGLEGSLSDKFIITYIVG